MMMVSASWVLIFIQVNSLSPAVIQPIYFISEDACNKVRDELNNGKTEDEMKKSGKGAGALCRSLGFVPPITLKSVQPLMQNN